jgi:hypothetical protein
LRLSARMGVSQLFFPTYQVEPENKASRNERSAQDERSLKSYCGGGSSPTLGSGRGLELFASPVVLDML